MYVQSGPEEVIAEGRQPCPQRHAATHVVQLGPLSVLIRTDQGFVAHGFTAVRIREIVRALLLVFYIVLLLYNFRTSSTTCSYVCLTAGNTMVAQQVDWVMRWHVGLLWLVGSALINATAQCLIRTAEGVSPICRSGGFLFFLGFKPRCAA